MIAWDFKVSSKQSPLHWHIFDAHEQQLINLWKLSYLRILDEKKHMQGSHDQKRNLVMKWNQMSRYVIENICSRFIVSSIECLSDCTSWNIDSYDVYSVIRIVVSGGRYTFSYRLRKLTSVNERSGRNMLATAKWSHSWVKMLEFIIFCT